MCIRDRLLSYQEDGFNSNGKQNNLIYDYFNDDLRENFVERLWEMNVDTHMIVGNHDIYYKNTNKVNSLTELFSTADHIIEPWIYSSPREHEFDGTKILMMPWINSGNREEALKFIKE